MHHSYSTHRLFLAGLNTCLEAEIQKHFGLSCYFLSVVDQLEKRLDHPLKAQTMWLIQQGQLSILMLLHDPAKNSLCLFDPAGSPSTIASKKKPS